VDYTIKLGNKSWGLQREYISLLDIMSFVATQLLCELKILEVDERERHSQSATWQDVLRNATRVRDTRIADFPPIQYIETYPLYHIDFRGDSREVKCQELGMIRQNYSAAFRALITRDINWNLKQTRLVNESLENADCTTRDSILWFVASQGAVKVYSDALETDFHVSTVLAAFEIELVLAMRYFLEKINYSLNAVPFESTSPGLLAHIHRRNIERLDSFFSLANCTKDTTARRLGRLKEAFGINQLSDTTAEKIRALSDLVTAYYNQRLQTTNERLQRDNERLQHTNNLLTLLFGVFGVGQLVSAFMFWYFVATPPSYSILILVVVITLVFMGVVGRGIYRWNIRQELTEVPSILQLDVDQMSQLQENSNAQGSVIGPQWSNRGRL
jgi:hypothetical protein